ncbi:hypothetical protein [Glycomyces buryatensis]|uniref:Uncharacterized protein n=1 Tax=Glycomyces buryatensis TaxID=2570927 RepID=A0A4S8Q8F6_9ACTN|nr:hypothetical protein [Glycomyces buryatensis]THV40558.1 hypothetical protein FAB82_14930 [Glycomyces buryatensis]
MPTSHTHGPAEHDRSAGPNRIHRIQKGSLMALNNSEARLVDDLVRIIDLTSRVLNAPPGSHYQWDKSRQLDADVKGLADRLGGDHYKKLPDPIDSEKVIAAVASDSQRYSIGRALYGTNR